MSASTRFPFSPREAIAFVVMGLAVGICLPLSTPAPAAGPVTGTPSADARTCAALAVYSMGDTDARNDWALKAAVSAVVLNTYERDTHAALCTEGPSVALKENFHPHRWQMALDVVDSVQTGDYLLPDDCFLATRVVAPGSNDRTPTSCVIQGYAFVRGDL